MVENNPNAPLAVEAMDELAFSSYLSGRQAALAALPMAVDSYPGKKMILELAIKSERDAAEMLRNFARITVTAGAAGEEMTVERRAATLVKLRQNLFTARQLFLAVKSKLKLLYSSNIYFPCSLGVGGLRHCV